MHVGIDELKVRRQECIVIAAEMASHYGGMVSRHIPCDAHAWRYGIAMNHCALRDVAAVQAQASTRFHRDAEADCPLLL